MASKVIRNAARCSKCKDIIESTHRHDFVQCTCATIFVDGGLDYLRRGGDFQYFEELSEWEEVDDKDTTSLDTTATN